MVGQSYRVKSYLKKATRRVKEMKRLSLALNILLISFLVWYFFFHVGAGKYYGKYISGEEGFRDDIYYKAKIAKFTALNELIGGKGAHTVFIGDSLIEEFPLNEFFGRNDLLNRGIGFDTTVGLLGRIEKNLNNIQTSKVFLLIGYNDLKYRTPQETWNNIERILRIINAKEKYIISLLPCSDSKRAEDIRRLNSFIRDSATEAGAVFIDAYDFFVKKGGELREEYFFDGVHLNVLGYQELARAVGAYLGEQNAAKGEN